MDIRICLASKYLGGLWQVMVANDAQTTNYLWQVMVAADGMQQIVAS